MIYIFIFIVLAFWRYQIPYCISSQVWVFPNTHALTKNVHHCIERCRMMVGRWGPEIKAGRFLHRVNRRQGLMEYIMESGVLNLKLAGVKRWLETLCRICWFGSWREEENSSGWRWNLVDTVLHCWQVQGRTLGILATLESRDTRKRTLLVQQSMHIHRPSVLIIRPGSFVCPWV